jgi:hypothetical protein
MPERIARLDTDARGYPIPWNVLRAKDGTPFFTVNDDRKAWRALREGLCPICGGKLGNWKWFTGGPKSAFDEHGWYLDLPGHHECIQFALATCPYLAAPRYLGRIDVADPSKLPTEAKILLDETILTERPEVFVAVAAGKVEAQRRPLWFGELQPYVRPSRPFLGYEFWRHGKQIALDEALPVLRGIFGAEWEPPKTENL